MKISIIAVNWWGEDYAKILIDSVKKNTKNDYEIIIVDNSGELPEYEEVRVLKTGENLGHGKGMDYGISQAKGEYILALDIDAHILAKDFDKKLIEEYEKDENTKIIGARGGLLKPIRPLFMFFEKDYFKGNSFEAVNLEGVKFDVGVHFYFKTLSDYKNVKFLEWQKGSYEDVWGENYTLNGESFCYHHWYGTRWFNVNGEKVHDEIDGRKYEDYKVSKNNLLEQYEK